MNTITGFLLWATLFMGCNLLDYHTTYSAMKGVSPQEMKEHELNPIAAFIIHKNKLVLALKIIVGVAVITFCFFRMDGDGYSGIKFVAIIFLMAVGNNLYAKWAEDHHKLSPGRFLMEKLKLPNKDVAFFCLLGIIIGIAYGLSL